MKKNILVVFLLFLFISSTVNAECFLPEDMPANPPAFKKIQNEVENELFMLNRNLIKMFECPTAYPMLTINGRTYLLFFAIKQQGAGAYDHVIRPMVAVFEYTEGDWEPLRCPSKKSPKGDFIFYLDGSLDDWWPGIYFSIVKNYNWRDP